MVVSAGLTLSLFFSWALSYDESIMKMLLLDVQCPYGASIYIYREREGQAHPYYICISITVSLVYFCGHMAVISHAYKLNKIWHLYVTFYSCSQSNEREIERVSSLFRCQYNMIYIHTCMYLYTLYSIEICPSIRMRSRLLAHNHFEMMSVPVPLSYFYRIYTYLYMMILF